MKIKAIVEIINSRRDRYGNVYFLFIYTDTTSGKSVRGRISGGDSNISCAIRELHESTEVYWIRRELPIRAFGQWVKELAYAGCAPEEISKFIVRELVLVKLS